MFQASKRRIFDATPKYDDTVRAQLVNVGKERDELASQLDSLRKERDALHAQLVNVEGTR
jgi:uncharacterized coiled-coil DUF342 family protein